MTQSYLVLSINQVRNDKASNKMIEINNLSEHKIDGVAASSTLVEDLASHMQRKQTKLKIKH
jgi:hypothetical protein